MADEIAAHGRERDERLREIARSMRAAQPYKSHDLGFADSISANRVEEWADEIEAALADRPQGQEGDDDWSASEILLELADELRCEPSEVLETAQRLKWAHEKAQQGRGQDEGPCLCCRDGCSDGCRCHAILPSSQHEERKNDE